jgi:hypothetical protein
MAEIGVNQGGLPGRAEGVAASRRVCAYVDGPP